MDDKELRTQSGDYKTIFYACNCGSYKFTKTLFFVALTSLFVSIFCFFALDSDVQLEERLVWKHENIFKSLIATLFNVYPNRPTDLFVSVFTRSSSGGVFGCEEEGSVVLTSIDVRTTHWFAELRDVL